MSSSVRRVELVFLLKTCVTSGKTVLTGATRRSVSRGAVPGAGGSVAMVGHVGSDQCEPWGCNGR